VGASPAVSENFARIPVEVRQRRVLPTVFGRLPLAGRLRVRAVGTSAPNGKKTPDLVAVLHCLLEHDTAGDPITGLRWSRRTTTTITEELAKLGLAVSPNTVARLLHQMGYSLRLNHKQISTSSSPHRNLQFEYLADLRDRFQRRHLPIVSGDSKKRELVGNFKNPGGRWERAPRYVYDHDFRTDSIGVAIPYGIYDVNENRGALVLAFPTTLLPSPLMPSLVGGARKVPPPIPVHADCSSWPIPAAAIVAAATPGKPSSSLNWSMWTTSELLVIRSEATHSTSQMRSHFAEYCPTRLKSSIGATEQQVSGGTRKSTSTIATRRARQHPITFIR
jgi:hypothetical protein